MSDVFLYIYDLSGGLASLLSSQLLGRQIGGIWHTAAVLYDKEFFFCQSGIQYCKPCSTSLGNPLKKEFMGRTILSESEIFKYLEQLSNTLFKPGDYSLFEHNCNTFSDHFIYHLTSTHIPSEILNLPKEVLSTPFGASVGSAVNALSAGITSETNMRSIRETRPKTINPHSYDYIVKYFRPIFFDEPLSSELLPHRVYLIWPADDNSSLATLAADLSQALSKENTEIPCAQECSALLALDQLTTGDQCRAACELFRLAIWKDPNILMNLLTDPRRFLHKLSTVKIPYVKPYEFYDIETSRAKLLCNCLGLSSNWGIMNDCDIRLDLNTIIQTSLTLLNHDIENYSSRAKGTRASTVAPTLLPEHKLVGLALAHNVSLYPTLSENDALELGSFLLHVASTGEESFKYPMEGIYLIRAIYFLVVRFSSLAALAKCCEISSFLQEIMDESTRLNSSAASSSLSLIQSDRRHYQQQQNYFSHFSQKDTSQSPGKIECGLGSDSLTSADYLVASRLLDFLSNNHESDDPTKCK